MVSYESSEVFQRRTLRIDRYRRAVEDYQGSEYKVMFSLNIMNVTQNLVFTLGLLVTCFIAAYQVTTGQRKVGRFVALLTYMAQLQGPLNFFGTFTDLYNQP
jgi:ABC-type transport system involved in Fe-S cluster assembly fused permease/ATPase subunit